LCLVLGFWVCTFVVKLGFFLAVSWDDLRVLLIASLRQSAPAMWLVPGLLLLSAPSTSAMVVGLLLVANTTRLLVSRNVPQSLAPAPQESRRHRLRLFRTIVPTAGAPFSPEISPAVIGAMSLQAGMFAMLAEHPWIAASLVAFGVIVWTSFSIVKGTIGQDGRDRPSYWRLSLLLTLLLTTWLTETQIRMQMSQGFEDAADPGMIGTLQQVWSDLEEGTSRVEEKKRAAKVVKPKRDAAKKEETFKPINIPGAKLVPGVILRPEKKEVERAVVMPRMYDVPRIATTVWNSLTIPFTGEYRIFPTSSAGLNHVWAAEFGTLLDNAYATAGGGRLETQAYQQFVIPIDFTNCRKVQMALVNAEDGPFGAVLHLETAVGSVELGSEIGGLDRHAEETLEFEVPEGTNTMVRAFRVAFQRIPVQGSKSLKVDVQSFTLVPRKR
jgi:hypothetical protein